MNNESKIPEDIKSSSDESVEVIRQTRIDDEGNEYEHSTHNLSEASSV